MTADKPLEAVNRLAAAIAFATVSDPADPDASADEPANGMLWCLPGTNNKLKPRILLARHDVVPAPRETLQKWTHPPYQWPKGRRLHLMQRYFGQQVQPDLNSRSGRIAPGSRPTASTNTLHLFGQ